MFQCSQYEIGRLWQMNKLTVAQEHYCSAATQLIMSLLYPRIFDTKKDRPRLGGSVRARRPARDRITHRVRFLRDRRLGYFLPGCEHADLRHPQHTWAASRHVLALSATMTFHVAGGGGGHQSNTRGRDLAQCHDSRRRISVQRRADIVANCRRGCVCAVRRIGSEYRQPARGGRSIAHERQYRSRHRTGVRTKWDNPGSRPRRLRNH